MPSVLPQRHPADQLEERLVNFAVSVMKVADELPSSLGGRHIAGQLLRSGTSPAPNYAEGRSAESRNDFVHKLKIVLKEWNETRVWLSIISRAAMLPAEALRLLLDENQQLCRIINASITTARRNQDE